MGAPPPGQFASSTIMDVRGKKKYPGDAKGFEDALSVIFGDNDGFDGMSISFTGGDTFSIENTNDPADEDANKAFADRFKSMRRRLEDTIEGYPKLATVLTLISTGPASKKRKTAKKKKATKKDSSRKPGKGTSKRRK